MPRWITVTKAPFDFVWQGRAAITAFTVEGEFHVKDEIADFAVARGFAKEGRAADSKTRSSKGGPRAVRAKPVLPSPRPANRRAPELAAEPAAKPTRQPRAKRVASDAIDATAANLQPDNRLDGADLSDDGRATHGRRVDPDAS